MATINIKVLLGHDRHYDKCTAIVPDDYPVGPCLCETNTFPPRLHQIKAKKARGRRKEQVVPAIFAITEIPDQEHINKALHLLMDCPAHIWAGMFEISYQRLITHIPLGESRCRSLSNQQTLNQLARKFKLHPIDLTRMAYITNRTANYWLSNKKNKGRHVEIAAPTLELIRLKLGDKELIPASASYFLPPEKRIYNLEFTHEGKPTLFSDLPNEMQIYYLSDIYKLKKRELAQMTLRDPKSPYAWLDSPDKKTFRRISDVELELVLLRLNEIPLELDRKVTPLMRKRFYKTGLTRSPHIKPDPY